MLIFISWLCALVIWLISSIMVMLFFSYFWNLNSLNSYDTFQFPIITIYTITFSTLVSINIKYYIQNKELYKRKLLFDIKFIFFSTYVIIKLSLLKNINTNFAVFLDIFFFSILFYLYFFRR